MAAEKIYDLWASCNPQWEKRYEDSIIKNFCDYGRGATSLREDREKVFGGGYEIFIVAFFMGLYFNQKRPSLKTRKNARLSTSPFNIGVILIPLKGKKHIRNFVNTFSQLWLPAPILISSPLKRVK